MDKSADLPADVRRQLEVMLPADSLLSEPADRWPYGYDNSRLHALPAAVVLPDSEQQVQAIVALCAEHGLPLVTRGRGTNTTGATVPTSGGIVLSLERMNKILRISGGDRLIECEAGTLNGDVQAAAAELGLFWPPDPSSAGYSSVGGNIGCNAGGPKAVKYGTARDHILGLNAIDGLGRAFRSGTSTSKCSVGYDLTRLLCGSEGTLAVITRARLRLLPRPQCVRTMRAAYRDVSSAAEAVANIMTQPHTPCALEYLDDHAVALVRQDGVQLPDNAGALLLIEADGDDITAERGAQAIGHAAKVDGLIELKHAESRVEASRLWAARKALSPALRRLAPKKVNEDVAVPVSRLPALIEGVRELSRLHALRIVCFGHAGNGNIHVNILADPDDPAQMSAIDACLGEVFRLVLSLDGTLSGEHGVGLSKRDFVAWELSAATLDRMRDIKQAFDPRGILNPGKSLPPG